MYFIHKKTWAKTKHAAPEVKRHTRQPVYYASPSFCKPLLPPYAIRFLVEIYLKIKKLICPLIVLENPESPSVCHILIHLVQHFLPEGVLVVSGVLYFQLR